MTRGIRKDTLELIKLVLLHLFIIEWDNYKKDTKRIAFRRSLWQKACIPIFAR